MEQEAMQKGPRFALSVEILEFGLHRGQLQWRRGRGREGRHVTIDCDVVRAKKLYENKWRTGGIQAMTQTRMESPGSR
jgi:hypothetical protein